jgi:hypothetical protein
VCDINQTPQKPYLEQYGWYLIGTLGERLQDTQRVDRKNTQRIACGPDGSFESVLDQLTLLTGGGCCYMLIDSVNWRVLNRAQFVGSRSE